MPERPRENNQIRIQICLSDSKAHSLKKKTSLHYLDYIYTDMDFPGSSAGKESTCNAEEPSSVPGSGRLPGEGMGCPLQYSWASLVAQAVKNPPAMQETWV